MLYKLNFNFFSTFLRKILIISVLVLALFTFFPGKTNAQEIDPNRTKRGLILTPVIKYLNGRLGQTITEEFKLTHDYPTDEPVTIIPIISSLRVDDEGNPSPGDESEVPKDLVKWTTISEKKVVLAPKEIKIIKFTIVVPQDAPGGTHSALILFSKVNGIDVSETTSKVEINERLGLPFFLTLNHQINFFSSINKMFITDIKNVSKYFFTYGDAKANIEINNSGNVYVRPYGDIFVYKKDKSQPLEQYPFNPKNTLIQQQNKRNYSFNIKTNEFINEEVDSWLTFDKYNFTKFFKFKMGRYHVTYQAMIRPSAEAGLPENKIISDSISSSFFVVPIQIIVLVLLFIIFPVLYFTIKKVREKIND